jgi:hypothetical protein
MRTNTSHWALLVLCVFCSSCETGPKQKVAVPLTPAPQVKPAPIVVAQTVAQLPDPQPVPPESVPARPPVEYHPPVKETEAEPEPQQDLKTTRQPAKTPRPVRRPAGDVPVPETASPAATPPAEESPKLSTADAASISKEQVNATLGDVQRILKDLAKRPQTLSLQATIARIHSFVKQAEQSAARNDLRQGDILAHRALALARDLAEPK